MNYNFTYPYPAFMDKESVAKLEPECFSGRIHVIEHPDDVAAAVAALRRFDTLGFDTETKPSFTAGTRTEVSLLQLSTDEDCYLFRLHKTDLTTDLRDLLADPTCLKIGLSVHDDFISLRRRSPFAAAGFVELQRLCPAYGIREQGLQKVYAIMYGKRISKSQRLSNWEAQRLSPAQQKYAATDAWTCLRIFRELMSLPSPSPVQFAFL